MKLIEKKIQILLRVKLEVLEEECVRNMFTEVIQHLVIDEKYEMAAKVWQKQKEYNKILKKNKDIINKKKLRKLIL